jgi:O-antigen ligase
MSDSTSVATPRHRQAVGVRMSVVQAAIGGAALLVGILAAIRPELAVAAIVGLALVPIVLARPIVGLCTVVFLSFLETYSAMTGVVSATKIVGGILILAWLGFIATANRRERDDRSLMSREPLLAASLVLFVAWASTSLVWAEVPAIARSSLVRYALNFVLFPIALLAIRTPRQVMWLIGTFVAGAATAVAFALLTGTIHDAAAEDRLKGAGLNPNQLGSYLVVVTLFAATLAANRRWSASARVVTLVVAALAGIGVFMTISRGALVGLAAALVLAPLVMGRGRRFTALVFVTAAVLGSVTWYAVFAPTHAVERITHPEQAGGSGREDLWRIGWRMVEDRPLLGVGAGNFPEASIHYLLRPGGTQRDTFIVDEKKVAHNIYLTVLSELGAVGLALFLLILGRCLLAALQAARRFAEQGDPTMELVARGLFLALLSLVVTDFFSSALYSKQLWVLLALAPALLAIAERSGAGEDANVTLLSRQRLVRARPGG